MSVESDIKNLMQSLSEMIETNKMIAINASIVATQLQHFGEETRAFKQLAKEIGNSTEGISEKIKTVEQIYADFVELSKIINIAGRQRMLSQKFIKIYFIEKNELLPAMEILKQKNEVIDLFENSIIFLISSKYNTEEIVILWSKIDVKWKNIKRLYTIKETLDLITEIDSLLESLQQVVGLYEKLAG